MFGAKAALYRLMKIASATASKGTQLQLPQRIEAPFSMAASTRTATPKECSARGPHLEQVPLPIIPSTEASSRHSSPEYSSPSLRSSHKSQESEERDDSPESDDDEFDSGNETVTNHHPITPCRTPRLPKTARAKTAEKGPSDSVMSSKKHRDILNRCIDGSPKTQKRYRDDLILDRGDLEKENARLKERVELWNSLRSRDGDSTEMLPFPMWQLKPLFFSFSFFFFDHVFQTL